MARKPRPKCSVRRCKRRPNPCGLCNTHLLQKADKAFSKYIRERDKRCQRCGAKIRLQCAHVISRAYRSVRWDELNAMTLCASDHVYFTHHPLEWEVFVDEIMGDGFWVDMRSKALTPAEDWKELALEWIDGNQE